MNAALDDVIVLDLTSRFSSSLTAAFLADFGGNVIRVELATSPQERGQAEAGWNHEADLIHRNKQSVLIDPGKTRGRELLVELANKADVIIVLRSNSMKRDYRFQNINSINDVS